MSLNAQLRIELSAFVLDMSLAIESGHTTAVIGPNGAGKTTLLRALAGLRALSAGTIELDDVVFDKPSTDTFVAPEHRPVGVVFHDNLLFPHLDALDNVAFGLRTRGFRRSKARQMAAEWLDRVGLGDFQHTLPLSLSGGQAQRVALARALAPSPKLLLLDEPLAALDVTTRDEVRQDLLQHLSTFCGVRILITHDFADAAMLADKVVALDHGAVVQLGSPAEVAAKPATAWVAKVTSPQALI